MKVSILERQAVLKLEPALIEAYLSSREWRTVAQIEDTGRVWTMRANDETIEVFVPTVREVLDFSLRVSEALRSLAEVERRSEFDLYQDILLAGNDMVVVRVPQPNGNSDLDLPRMVSLVNGASEMMLSAACSAVAPQPAYMFRRPRQALEYVSSLRALQTTLDDPTITILSPIPPVYHLPRWQNREFDPFERSVVRGLESALRSIHEMERGLSLDQERADSLVEQGVSANLYDALVGMLHGDGQSSKLGIEIRYAPVRREANPPTFFFSPGDIGRFERSSSQLRSYEEGGSVERVVIAGFTVGLRRPTHSRRGQVTIEQALRIGETRRIRVELAETEYSLAARAHSTRSRVRVSGILQRHGRYWILGEPQGFSVVED